MGGKMSWAKEGSGCDEAAAAAAGTSGDSGGGAPSPSTSPTPSTSATPQSPKTAHSSPPRTQSPRLTPSSPSPPQSPTTASSSTSSSDEEIARGEEQEVDQLKEYFGSSHLDCTSSEEFDDIFESDDNGIFSNKSKLGDKEPVLTLLEDFVNDTIIGKIVLLDEKYGSRRRTAGDGNCFYRSFIFKYLENVVEMKDENERRTEASRLRQRVENYMPICHDEQLLHSFFGFESMVNLVEQGLVDGGLYQMDMNEDVTSRILPLLRALTEIEIWTRPDFYHGFLIPEEGYESVFELCLREVRVVNGEASNIQVYALVNALGVPIILENLDANEPVKLNPVLVRPTLESDGPRNLSPAEQRRVVTLLYRPGHYDIIYPK